MDHDQRFKVMLEEFFPELVELFWPALSTRFDFSTISWLKEELFSDPPKGERNRIDLVAQLRLKKPVTKKQKKQSKLLALVHVEIESRQSLERLRPRIYDYYHQLRRKYKLPVLPIAILLRVALDGLGTDIYEEYFDDLSVLIFRYMYAGLPGLDGSKYLESDNSLGIALSALMSMPKKQRVERTAQALDRLVKSKENMWRKFILCECVQAYAPLDATQRMNLDQLLITETYSGVQTMNKTWYEKGEEKGLERGLERGLEQGRRGLLLELLEKKFGKLNRKVKKQLQEWPDDRLAEIGEALWKADSIGELGLEE